VELLTSRFSVDNFGQYISALLNNEYDPDDVRSVSVDKEFHGIKSIKLVAEYEDDDLAVIIALAVELENNTYIGNQRAYQRGVVSYILGKSREWKKAIVAFHTEGEKAWRLSYIKVDEEVSDSVVAPLYRWSFLVGEGEPCKTIKDSSKKLIEEYHNKPILVENIEPVFTSMNAVTNEFYRQFMLHYDLIRGSMSVHMVGKSSTERTIKLIMGQTIALFFLQKRGFLGVKEGEPWGTGDKNYVTSKILSYTGTSIYNDVFAPLMSALAGDSVLEGENIPVLNGGLFTVIETFEDGSPFRIPTRQFQNFVEEISNFNFTVSESDQYDKDVAVDPEMLGKIYEHLASIDDDTGSKKKLTGLVYTPSDIVTFMCKEGISNWLYSKLNMELPKSSIDDLIDTPELNIELLVSLDKSKDTNGAVIKEDVMRDKFNSKGYVKYLWSIDSLLKDFTILEPSVGSGAFLVGMLLEVTKLRHNIGVILHFLREINNTQFLSYSNYSLKRHTILTSLYGVDVNAGAVDIAKLRTWLSLIVDMENPMLLPNLDFKIVVGNSVVDRVWNKELVPDIAKLDLSNLEVLKQNYATERHGSKMTLKDSITRELVVSLAKFGDNAESSSFSIEKQDGSLQRLSEIYTQSDLDELFKRVFSYDFSFSEVMKNGGFDIVIGNPPYVRGTRLGEGAGNLNIKDELSLKFKTTFHGTADLLVYFYENGYNLLRENGVLAYITSNKWLTAKYGESLRKLLVEKTELLVVVDFKDNRVFKGVGVETEITVLRKSKPSETSSFVFCNAEGYSVEE
jgi:type I restriction-modification system DNA methylase subunit